MAIAWLVFILVVLLRSTVPNLGPSSRLGSDELGHLAIAALMGVLVTGLLAVVDRWPLPEVSWYATLSTATLVLAFELAQIPVPVRSFEQDDLIYGVAGSLVGVAGAGAALAILGRRIVLVLFTVVGTLGLALSITVVVIRDPARLAAQAAQQQPVPSLGSQPLPGD